MTTWATDDLAQIVIAPEREFAGFAQGILRAWDSDTFENAVEVRGGTLTNLPVAAGVEALTYQAGDVLMLTRWKLRSGKGAATYWIGMGGRVIFPGTGASEQAIAWMRGSLAKQIARGVIAETMRTDVVNGIGERNNEDYGDLSLIDPGPTVANVDISPAGRAVVALSCSMTVHIDAGRQGFMAVQVSGATSRLPDDGRAYVVGVGGDPSLSVDPTGQASEFVIIDGLNPGVHTFQAKYRTITEDGPVQFISPEMVVWAF